MDIPTAICAVSLKKSNSKAPAFLFREAGALLLRTYPFEHLRQSALQNTARNSQRFILKSLCQIGFQPDTDILLQISVEELVIIQVIHPIGED